MQLIYGINPVLEALKADLQIKTIVISQNRQDTLQEIINCAKAKNIPVNIRPKEYFDQHYPKGHQGVSAELVSKKNHTVSELITLTTVKAKPAFFIIIDCVEDPHNFGAILRVAECSGADGVIYQTHRSAGINATVAKASAGAISHLYLAEVVNIKHAIAKMKDSGIMVVGAEAYSNITLWDIDLTSNIALVVGSEGKGMRKTVKEMCDYIISLPMLGSLTSLNVSVATGIIAYEMLRQRRDKGILLTHNH